jgi:hypothetical protein
MYFYIITKGNSKIYKRKITEVAQVVDYEYPKLAEILRKSNSTNVNGYFIEKLSKYEITGLIQRTAENIESTDMRNFLLTIKEIMLLWK